MVELMNIFPDQEPFDSSFTQILFDLPTQEFLATDGCWFGKFSGEEIPTQFALMYNSKKWFLPGTNQSFKEQLASLEELRQSLVGDLPVGVEATMGTVSQVREFLTRYYEVSGEMLVRGTTAVRTMTKLGPDSHAVIRGISDGRFVVGKLSDAGWAGVFAFCFLVPHIY